MKRSPQLALRLDAAAPDIDAQWRAGAAVTYLGARLSVVLDTDCRTPERRGAELHLPLPPAATPRQIRDAAESWLRDEAQRIFDQVVAEKSALEGRWAPKVVLVFGKRGDWARCEGELLRCHWRLVEQPDAVIGQVLGGALAASAAPACDDLFALV
jgi:predicted metal-dependent hydrolase